MKTIRLREGKERSLQRHHPWVFQGSIAKGGGDSGETVRVEAADGSFLAWGAFSPSSMIRVRAWSFDEAERIDAAFFARRLQRAVALRQRLAVPSDGVRLVHGEADGLPGLIVDRYGDVLSAQFLSAGTERWREAIADALMGATSASRLYERSDAGVRGLEGLPARTGWLRGEGASEVTIAENGWRLTLDVAQGHKTGYYLDQRDNRALFAQLVRQFGCRRVLNCYAYTGGFSVAAAARGLRPRRLLGRQRCPAVAHGGSPGGASQGCGLTSIVAATPSVAGFTDPAFPEDAIEVGRVVDAWGVKGWIKVQPFASDPQALFSSKRWFVKPPEDAVPQTARCQGIALPPAAEDRPGQGAWRRGRGPRRKRSKTAVALKRCAARASSSAAPVSRPPTRTSTTGST